MEVLIEVIVTTSSSSGLMAIASCIEQAARTDVSGPVRGAAKRERTLELRHTPATQTPRTAARPEKAKLGKYDLAELLEAEAAEQTQKFPCYYFLGGGTDKKWKGNLFVLVSSL